MRLLQWFKTTASTASSFWTLQTCRRQIRAARVRILGNCLINLACAAYLRRENVGQLKSQVRSLFTIGSSIIDLSPKQLTPLFLPNHNVKRDLIEQEWSHIQLHVWYSFVSAAEMRHANPFWLTVHSLHTPNTILKYFVIYSTLRILQKKRKILKFSVHTACKWFHVIFNRK